MCFYTPGFFFVYSEYVVRVCRHPTAVWKLIHAMGLQSLPFASVFPPETLLVLSNLSSSKQPAGTSRCSVRLTARGFSRSRGCRADPQLPFSSFPCAEAISVVKQQAQGSRAAEQSVPMAVPFPGRGSQPGWVTPRFSTQAAAATLRPTHSRLLATTKQ